MMQGHKTNEQIVKELEEMRQQQKQLELCRRELLSVQKKYDKIIEFAPDAMVFLNREGKIVYINVQLVKMFGYDEEELVGRDLEILIPERFRATHRRNVASFFSAPGVRPMGAGMEIFGLKKDGTEIETDVSLSHLETDVGLLAIADIRDVTERRRAVRKIERSYYIQQVISSVLKISLEPIPLDEQLEHILDSILSIPGFALQAIGSIYLVEDEPEVLVLKTPRRLSRARLTACEKIPFGKCLCGQAAASGRIVFAAYLDNRHEIRHESESPHGHYCVPIVSGGKTLGLINVFVEEGRGRTAEDDEFLSEIAITLAGIIERRHAEAEKSQLRAQLHETEKIAALGRITANVAHDIRNPLTAIGGFTRRLHKKFADGTKEKEYTGLIFSEVIRLEGILRNVLSLSRRPGPIMERCNIQEIIEKALMIYGEICSEQSIIINRSFGDIPLIEGDKEQILQAIENLFSNAIDAMPGGGTLTVISSKESARGKTYVAVKIHDTGMGIREEDLSKVFEPFFTTKYALKGAGLGLSITKKIAEDHGGFVRIESRVGAGSTFSLYFPCKPEL
ncbi:MAG: ATP-binding protein [Nitrospirota bacterium]|nr:ATP-binding protein [Nitrospirota bacterium]